MAFLEKKALYGPWFVTVNIRDSQNVTTITEASRICHVAIIIARPSRNLVFKANLAFIRHGFQQKLRFLKRILVSILSFVHANNSLWICHGSVTYMSWTTPSRVLPILIVTDVRPSRVSPRPQTTTIFQRLFKERMREITCAPNFPKLIQSRTWARTCGTCSHSIVLLFTV